MNPVMPNVIMPGPQKVNIEQLKISIQFEQGQLKVFEVALEAWNKRGDYERSYIRHVYERTIKPFSRDGESLFLENYLRWHKAYYDAEAEIRTIQIAQLKGSLAIKEAMMEEAQKPPLVRGNVGLT